MEDCELNDRVRRTTVLNRQQSTRKLRGEVSELRHNINKQKEYFTKPIKLLKKQTMREVLGLIPSIPTKKKKKRKPTKKKRTEILELKNSIHEVKNELASLGNGADQMEERISDVEHINLEIIAKRKKDSWT